MNYINLNIVESKEGSMVGPVVGSVVGGISVTTIVAVILTWHIRRRYKCVVREEGTQARYCRQFYCRGYSFTKKR